MTFAEFLVRAFGFGIHDLFQTGIIRAICNACAPGEVARALLFGGGFLLVIAAAYLLGSVNTALVVSKVFYKDDVREHGSGNAGTTNILRTYGKKPAILTFVGDALKAVVAIVFAAALFGHPAAEYHYFSLTAAVYLAAFFCVLGHIFPVFSHFRGGKGFATMVGVILVLNPAIFLLLFLVYVPLILMSHYISLSSVVMALFYPMMLSVVDNVITGMGVHVLLALGIGVLITFAHRENIKRIYEGNERKFYPFGHKAEKEAEREREQEREAAQAAEALAAQIEDDVQEPPRAKKPTVKSKKNLKKMKKMQEQQRKRGGKQ